MHKGSIIGITVDGIPDSVNGFGPSNSVIFRNDFPLAEKICNRLAAFHFRRRQGFAYVGMRPDAPPTWAYIGCPVSKVIESTVGDNAAEVSATYNVVIEKIDVVLGDKPRITVHGELPSAPSFGSSPSPSSGGSISIAQNGTLAQAVAQVRQDVNALAKDGQRTPLVLPYSPTTHHTIGANELALMKPTAVLVNIARGGIVDDAALIDALKRNRIAAAGLDVFENEPTFNPALLELTNVVLTPHIGSSSRPTRMAMAATAATNLIAALTGRVPPNLLNPDVLKSRA
jgi:hypothetical protein